ncbi:AAA family ATPase (plasmid) [Cupriavidus pauculus]|uniref:AAA family ATPase n=1 Tax=Cupriavidus pauculus TaxID=82633 RepID=A0A5P2H8V3_9BURK|nr:SbcC/MukB-like Walker B domain-containing protein [Cupriavidus pauculus]QET03915.1 AAA family ATPase [Cupriavidus pauculus]
MTSVDSHTSIEALVPDAAFVLTRLDVFNWGPFGGRHQAEIDIEGTAIIGQTGSGKTTLVDALMTLIAAQPRYNLASTGGHESDRDLVSYVRGVSGAGRSGETDHIARPGKTVSGISATFANGSRTVTIAGIFALDGTGSSATDLDRVWLISKAAESDLDEWLETMHAGGKRALRQLERDIAELRIYDSKKAYVAELRRYFEVGENAFTLLNRAAGLKQLNSIDELFRELVLDDRAAFQRAQEVASEFDDLAAIREELAIARKQRDSLLPIQKSWDQRIEAAAALDLHRQLAAILPVSVAIRGHRLWAEVERRLGEELESCNAQVASLTARVRGLESDAEHQRDLYIQSGGANVELLEQTIDAARGRYEIVRRNAQDYARMTASLQQVPASTQDDFIADQARLRTQASDDEASRIDLENQAFAAGAMVTSTRALRGERERSLSEAQARPGSNVPIPYQKFRLELADHLNLHEASLPYVAELVQVQEKQAHWRGAIERAIGGHRLRILVRVDHIREALAWVNGRDNKIHVRLIKVAGTERPAPAFENGFTRKLNFKEHPYQDAVRALLVGFDRHCVASPEALRETPHGMTAQGLMSGKDGLFEKQDLKPLNEGWLTGFDNSDSVAALERDLEEVLRDLKTQEAQLEVARARVSTATARKATRERLLSLTFEDIDVVHVKTALDRALAQLAALTSAHSDTTQAKKQWEATKQELEKTRSERDDSLGVQGNLILGQKNASTDRQRMFALIGEGLDATQMALAQEHFDLERIGTIEDLQHRHAKIAGDLHQQVEQLTKRITELERQLVRGMGAAQTIDTGALAEVGTDLEDVPHYLARLKILIEEALPEKQDRFISYLNQSSDEGVTQLLRSIDNEVETITERIADLNDTMRRVNFQHDRYLRLEPRRVVHESLRTLEQAQRHLRSTMLVDDLGESQFAALSRIVALLKEAAERRTTVGSRALLDPRYRLQFSVSVIARGSGEVVETRTGSQGGSGGEKEIIASYILTASLSYALCPEGKDRPLFGTIVLDEAFSKSSQAVAGRIISALREFGLHPLFVTPNKEMRLLRAHTRSAVLVHRRGLQATMTSLSWEELDTFAKARQQADRDEVAS